MANIFLIWGGYGNENLGDEACLLASARLLEKNRPGARTGLILRMRPSAEVADRYRSWGLEPIYCFSFLCLQWLWRAQLIVGGGGMVDDDTPWFPVAWSSLFVFLNKLFGNEPVFFCIGANPIHRRFTKTLVKMFYSLAQTIITRDIKSFNVLIAERVPRNRLRLARDVVFSLDRDTLPSFKRDKRERPHVVLVVRNDSARTPGQSDFFAAIAEQFVEAGCSVCLTVHDLRMEYDLGILLQLERRFHDNALITVSKPNCLHHVLHLFASADAVVSSRYHPIILASILGSTPIAVSHSLTMKLGSLVDDLGVPVLKHMESRASQVDEIRSIFAKEELVRANISGKVREFKLAVEDAVGRALDPTGSLQEAQPEIAA